MLFQQPSKKYLSVQSLHFVFSVNLTQVPSQYWGEISLFIFHAGLLAKEPVLCLSVI